MKGRFPDADTWRQWARRALYPPVWLVWLAAALSAVLLVWVFSMGLEESVVAYIAYPLSAWALTVAVIRLLPVLRTLPGRMKGSRYAARILGNDALCANVSMYAGLGVSLFYAAFKLVAGWIYDSKWFMAVAVYYMVLALMRYLLMRGVKGPGAGREDISWYIHRAAGLLMLILTAAIAGMAVQMVVDNQVYSYPGLIIYASAAYAFYSLTAALVNLIRFRKEDDPVASAARVIALAGALMAIYALQTGLIDRFGEGDETLRLVMNALTGGAVCLAVLSMGVMMVARSQREISRIRRERAQARQ